MNIDEITNCPGTLAEGFSTYSPSCIRNLFNGKKVSHILPYDSTNKDEDVAEQFMDQELVTGNRYTIAISSESKEEAENIYNGLSADGFIEIPLAESHWGSYFGMFADKYGIQWMIDFDPKYN